MAQRALKKAKGDSLRDRHALIRVADGMATVTDFPIDSATEYVASSQTTQVLPGAPHTSYCSGPPGPVTVTLERVANSGDHYHGGGPTGSNNPSSFVLGPNYPQNVTNVFTAPDAAGTIIQKTQFSAGPSVTRYFNVGFMGFTALSGGVGIVLTGSTALHPSNHFGTVMLVQKVQQLAAAFHSKFGKSVFVNDMSLPSGGLFDYMGTWAPPHATHREGRTVDINSTSMNQQEQDFLRQTANSLGFQVALEDNPPHWHLTV